MSLADLRVMVVEDHEFEQRMALRFLAELGVVEPIAAGDGVQALELLRTHGDRFDIIICDLDMPNMDGVAFLRNVAERRLANAVIVASGLDASLLHAVETMARAYGLQVLGKIEKPLSSEKLQVLLAKYHELQPAHKRTSPQQFSRDELREAVDGGQIFPIYQPKVDLETASIVGAEALVRWRHPKHGIVSPSAFMSSLERHG